MKLVHNSGGEKKEEIPES